MGEKELEKEIERLEGEILKREQMITNLQSRLSTRVNPEDVAQLISFQQIESLKDHLTRAQRRSWELEERLENSRKRNEELERKVNNLQIKVREYESGRFNAHADMMDEAEIGDGELDDLFELDKAQPRESRSPGKRLVKLLAKHERMKVADAAVFMEMDKTELLKLAHKLRRKGLVEGGKSDNDVIEATRKLKRLSRRL